MNKIGEAYGVAADTVKSIILPITDTRDYIESSQLTPIDESYFKQVDTPYKAYWLGFTFAASYISKRGKNSDEMKLTYTFKDNELHIAKALKKALATDKDFSYGKQDNIFRLELLNRGFIEDVINLGMKPNNKQAAIFPNLPVALQVPFGRLFRKTYLYKSFKNIRRSC